MSSTSKMTSRSTPVRTGAGAGAGVVIGIAAASCRRLSVTFSGMDRSPLLLVAVAKEERDRVHQQEREHHDEDRGCREVDEFTVGVLRPREDLDRKRREGGAQSVGVEARVHCGAYHEQRRGLADRPRERKDDAGGDAGDRSREHLLPDRLPLRGAEREGAVADGRGHGPDRLARDDDHDRQHEQRERYPAREQRAAERQRAAHGERQPEDPVDDRGHGGEVLDVDLDQPVPPLRPVGVLLEVDRGRDAERHDDRRADDHQPQGPPDRRLDAGGLREDPRREATDEVPRELLEAVAGDVIEQRRQRQHAERDGAVHQRPEEARERSIGAARLRDHRAPPGAGGDLGAGHSYTCRYMRTSRIETEFSSSVSTNSVMPTTKIVSYSIEPVGMSPRDVAAMNAAIDRLAVWPPAIRMITVSPIAREAPSTSAATTPESAAGKTTRIAVCTVLAPSPAAPSRSDCGTADIESSTSVAIVGTTRTPRMIPAASALNWLTSRPRAPRSTSGVKNVRAK